MAMAQRALPLGCRPARPAGPAPTEGRNPPGRHCPGPGSKRKWLRAGYSAAAARCRPVGTGPRPAVAGGRPSRLPPPQAGSRRGRRTRAVTLRLGMRSTLSGHVIFGASSKARAAGRRLSAADIAAGIRVTVLGNRVGLRRRISSPTAERPAAVADPNGPRRSGRRRRRRRPALGPMPPHCNKRSRRLEKLRAGRELGGMEVCRGPTGGGPGPAPAQQDATRGKLDSERGLHNSARPRRPGPARAAWAALKLFIAAQDSGA